jgi:hypothetical protein
MKNEKEKAKKQSISYTLFTLKLITIFYYLYLINQIIVDKGFSYIINLIVIVIRVIAKLK